MIKMEKIRKVYNTGKIEVEALRGIDLHIKRGDFLTIMGHPVPANQPDEYHRLSR
jgi:putative ABC transport system ATP-binding protein